jgi:glycosyltransferase involved in cell wall biosynthesis
MEQEFSSPLKRLYTLLFLKKIESQAEVVFTDSQFTADRLKAYHLLQGEKKLVITPLGINSAWLNFQPGPRPHTNPYLLYVGNIKPHKNLKTLLKAHSLLSNAPDLILVGKKSGFIQGDQETISLATNNPKVHFTGEIPISDETLSQYYRHAEAMIFPSLYEGFGLPPLEAMASGCPCIVSDIAVLKESYHDSACFYSPPLCEKALAQKIQAVLENPDLRQNLRQNGLQKAISSTWEKAAQMISQEFLRVCS